MEIIAFFIIVLIASVIQTSTGFGFSILATPFLLLIFEPKDAIQLNLLISLVISAVLIIQTKKEIDRGILRRFILGSIAGLPIGLFILMIVDVGILKLGISVMILALTLLLMLRLRMAQSKGRDTVVGGCSGLLTSS